MLRKNNKIRVAGITNGVAKKFMDMAKYIQSGIDDMERKGMSSEEYIKHSESLMELQDDILKLNNKISKMFNKVDNK